MANLRIKYGDLELKNPLVAASATPTKDVLHMKKCVDAGLGGFVAKTPSWDRLEHLYPSPRFYVFYPDNVVSGKLYSFYTNELLSEYSPEEYARQLGDVLPYAQEHDCRVIASIMGGDDAEWVKMAEIFDPVCEAVEVNLACPYGGDLAGNKGCQVGSSPELVKHIIGLVRQIIKKHIIAKLPAEGGDLKPVFAALATLENVSVHTMHRYTGLEIDIETGKPILNAALSGYGGPWEGPISRKWVATAAQMTKLDITGGGGIDGWRDALAHMMAGARMIQMCGGPSLRGYGFFTKTIEGMDDWLNIHGYKNVDEIVGAALPHLRNIRQVPRKDVFKPLARVDHEKCSGCGACVDVCFYDAIIMEGKKALVNPSLCDGCALCTQMCIPQAIDLYDKDQLVPTRWVGARGRKGENVRKHS
jgi:dihydroorotate dehydrogenase (fumarate)/dihydropyrimidine dehydrogenase (NAD+) subunit PreA